MMKHTITRIYEIVVLLIVLGCLGQILWGAPTYDAQLSELQTAMNISWQQGHKKAVEDMENLEEDVHKNGNPREELESIKRAQLLIKKTTKINGLFERTNNQWHNGKQGFDALKRAVKKHADWINSEFGDFDLELVDPKHALAKYPHRSNATTIATKALIAEKKLQIQRLQAVILRKLGVDEITFTGCGLRSWQRVVPQTNVVQVGDTYTADLFLVKIRRYGSLTTRMYYNNKITGDGAVRFEVLQRGKQYWEAKFRYYTVDGKKDTTIVQKVYYEVK
ncbi:hypothetical protein [Microscilla marina]|uniref:Uncharacterized protein n=1 Tax=Microscilla marina ATCC 23134 TaxID=313606 RepID=A1ZLA9_MICM2|nr:hypothetical protein [Microscilla marina]EAY28663.1 hypothetical protein M23134_07761 [Microscilla marina ATCC 23134]